MSQNKSENMIQHKQQQSTRSGLRAVLFILTFILLMIMCFFIFGPSSQWVSNNNNDDDKHTGEDHSHFLKSSSFDNSTTAFIRHFIHGDDLQIMMDLANNATTLNDDVMEDDVDLDINTTTEDYQRSRNPPQLFADEQFPGFYFRMV